MQGWCTPLVCAGLLNVMCCSTYALLVLVITGMLGSKYYFQKASATLYDNASCGPIFFFHAIMPCWFR